MAVSLAAILLCVYQISFNVAMYLEKSTILSSSFEESAASKLPPITICPYPPFHPRRLASLGIDIDGDHYKVKENLQDLKGIDPTMNAKFLWDKAGWKLGEVVKSVRLSNEMFNYDSMISSSMYWYKLYSPIGPCFTLIPPLYESEVVIELHETPIVDLCSWTIDDVTYEFNGDDGDCDKVSKFCNTSCGLESHIYYSGHRSDAWVILFHKNFVTGNYNEESGEYIFHEKEVQSLLDGEYTVRTVTKSANSDLTLRMYVSQVDSKLIKQSCEPNEKYDQSVCNGKCISKTIRQSLYCQAIVSPDILSQNISGLCSSTNQIGQIINTQSYICDDICLPRCVRTYAKQNLFEIPVSHELKIEQKLSSRDIHVEYEFEIYSLSHLMSDVGGCLGFFLGISALIITEFLPKLWMVYKNAVSKHKVNTDVRFYKLFVFVCITVLMGAASVHFLVTLQSYLKQPVLTSVSVSLFSHSTKSHEKELSAKSAVARRLASRSLGCISEESEYDMCLVGCLLEKTVDDLSSIIPFFFKDDLQLCKPCWGCLPKQEYIVPSDMLTTLLEKNRLSNCSEICKDFNDTLDVPPDSGYMVVNTNYFSFTVSSLLCTLGGILGLYLGWSIFDAIDITFRQADSEDKYQKESKKITSDLTENSNPYSLSKIFHFKNIFKILFCVVGVGLSVWQLYIYLFHHAASGMTSRKRLLNEHLPTITLCRWPPFDITSLAKDFRLENLTELFLSLERENELDSFKEVFQYIPENINISLNELWKNYGWNISDVVSYTVIRTLDKKVDAIDCERESCEGFWKPILTPLNLCYSLDVNHKNSTIVFLELLYANKLMLSKSFGESNRLYFGINEVDDFPSFENMFPVIKTRSISTNIQTAYYKHEAVNTHLKYNKCTIRCVYDEIALSLNCKLPFMNWRDDLDICSIEEYRNISEIIIRSEFSFRHGRMDGKLHFNSNITKQCHLKCHNSRYVFHKPLVTILNFYETHPKLTINMDQMNVPMITEEDRYSISQVLSDIYSVVGATAGVSLISLMMAAISKFIKGDQAKI